MTVRLAVAAVGAANGGFNDALAVSGLRERESSVARVRLQQRRTADAQNKRLLGVTRDRVADEFAQFLFRDFH
jgi:hypothetical protein